MRAIAVLGVVAYHFQLARIDGGFVGVDVFFVISGFLMTQIIAGRLEHDRFSFADFYGARVRRIVPALAVLVAVVTLAGYLLLRPPMLEMLAQDAEASLLFVSNVFYIGQGGYFAVAANQNWLLHTWSLSVEGQFYILYPALLWALRRAGRGPRTTIAVLSVVAAFSFARTVFSSYAGGGALTIAFFMIHTRAWEFLVGGIAAYAVPRVRWADGTRATAHATGVVIVLASMVLLQSRTAVWPSALATCPVVGMVLVLLADRHAARWASLPPVTALGRWSYSIYLWHWPIAAMASFFGFWSIGARAGLALVSVGFGALSYRLIERSATNVLWLAPDRPWRLGLPVLGLTFAFAGVAQATHGLETIRFATRPEMLAALRDDRAAKHDWMTYADCDGYTRVSNVFTECRLGNPRSHETLVIGDSFVEQLVPRYRGALRNTDRGVTFLLRAGCVPLPGTERIPFGSNCAAWVKDVYAFARREDFRRIVFGASWTSYERNTICLLGEADCGASMDDATFQRALDDRYLQMGEEWRALQAQGKAVVAMEEPPFGGADPDELYARALDGKPVTNSTIPLTAFEQDRAAAMARLAGATKLAGATLVNPAKALCPNGLCPFVANGRGLYTDGFHLRASLMKDPRFKVYDRYLFPDDVPGPSIN